MNNNDRVIIIGWINKGKPADCGETMKNQLMIHRLEELGVKCYQVDFKNWRRHPWIFAVLLWYLTRHNKASIILSSSAKNIYPLLYIFKSIGIKRNIVHWVIGGNLNERICESAYSADILNYASYTLVETPKMVEDLRNSGLKNVMCVPNFKPISYLPPRSLKNNVTVKRFVFMSRIIAEKGVDYIIRSVDKLNSLGWKQTFTVDFYGKCSSDYAPVFMKKIDAMENVNYRGMLDFSHRSAYDTLASYHAMLFPTFWKGEGFAGVFIDAYIAGLPIITTDWGHNKSILGENAYYFPPRDADALTNIMKEVIDGEKDLDSLSLRMQLEVEKYNVSNVITEKLLNQIDL